MNRRTFLQLSTALGAACLQAAARPATRTAPLCGSAHAERALPVGRLSIASTFPLPFAHHYFPNAEALLNQRLDAFDLLLVPAYATAELIQRGALQKLPGAPGRAHDPDGAFTLPYLTAISALAYRGAPPSSLDDLWKREALWPDSPRLVIGAALLRRGYPLNDAHPDHLAQVERDLLQLRPRLSPDPTADVRSGLASFALAQLPAHADLTPAFGSPSPVGASTVPDKRRGVRSFIPPEGAALVEYDWAIPVGARNTEAALAFIANTQYAIRNTQPCEASPWDASPPMPHASRLTPFTPLPARALAQRAAIWARLRETLA